MFKLIDYPTFTHPVAISVPTDDGFETQTCKATFKVLPVEQSDQHDTRTHEGQMGFVRAHVVSMDEIAGADDTPLSWSAELAERLFAVPYVRGALIRTYFSSMSKAASGN